ncbi:ankyrin [Piromyces finnis]|uniref:Ankyrin n=1 Tax=Piromyces finnis TaxID=1754191 RepID=A0A1Y1V2J7_9FUNG|nr:ankyrin [Piromyces finnis]|eukprot:ORX45751.1 ankyrin [Piromyces finnis]
MSLFINTREKRLIQAVEENNIEYVNHLLNSKKSINLNYKNRNSYTPLLLAIKLGNREEIIRLLLNNKLNINYKTKENESALHLAIQKYNLDIIQLLIENKINVNEQDKYGKTPLIRIIELIKKYTIPNEVLNESIIKFATASSINGDDSFSSDDNEPAPRSKSSNNKKSNEDKILSKIQKKKTLKDESLFNDISLSSDFSWVENGDSGSLEVDEDYLDSLSISFNHVNVNELMNEILNENNSNNKSSESNKKECLNSLENTEIPISNLNSQETEIINVDSNSNSSNNSIKNTNSNLNSENNEIISLKSEELKNKTIGTTNVDESKSNIISNSKSVIKLVESLSCSDENNNLEANNTIKRKNISNNNLKKKYDSNINSSSSYSNTYESDNTTKITATETNNRKNFLVSKSISFSSLEIESSLEEEFNKNCNKEIGKGIKETKINKSSSSSSLLSSSSVSSITLRDVGSPNEKNDNIFNANRLSGTPTVANIEVVTNNNNDSISEKKLKHKFTFSPGIHAVGISKRDLSKKLQRKFTFTRSKSSDNKELNVNSYNNNNPNINTSNNIKNNDINNNINDVNIDNDTNTNTRINSITNTNTNDSNAINTITTTYMNNEVNSTSHSDAGLNSENYNNKNNSDITSDTKPFTNVNDKNNFPQSQSFEDNSHNINVIILSDDEDDKKSFQTRSSYYSDSESYSFSSSYSEFESLPLEMKSQNKRDFYTRDFYSKSNINLNEIDNISFSESIIPYDSFSIDTMLRKPSRSETLSTLDANRIKNRYIAYHPFSPYNRIGYSPANRLYNGIRESRKQSQIVGFTGYNGFTSGTGTLSSDLNRQKRNTISHIPFHKGLINENDQPGTESTRQKASKYLTMLETLLWNDADPNIQDLDGRTSLIIACIYKLRQVVPILLKYGTSVNTRDYLGKTALMYSCEKQEDGIVKQLLEYHSNINFQDNNGLTALMLACKNDNIDIIRLLLENRARVNRQDKNGDTALTIASRYGCVRAIQLLLRYCANTDIKNNRGETALIIACRHVNEEIIRILIKQPLDMDIQDRNGNTALIYLCQKKYEYTDIVQEFLNNQSLNVNIRNNAGNSALHISAFNNHQDIVRQLLFHHADINLKNGEGNTALMWVSSLSHHEDMAQLLLEFSSIYVTNRNIVKALSLRKKNKLNMRQCEDLILPYSFISLDETNNDGDTALIIASRSGQPKIVKSLLYLHANCNIQNNHLETALVKAIKIMNKIEDGHRIERYQQVIKLLILKNADTHIKDNKKHDFVYYASSNKLFMQLMKNISNRQKQNADVPQLTSSIKYYRY